ncbi:dUTP diphosphatase [Bacillus cereus]|uniref:dUTP diphosphatase n=1 Tax=Bacillus cereus TaxID=1396 RepID=UPI003D65E7CE
MDQLKVAEKKRGFNLQHFSSVKMEENEQKQELQPFEALQVDENKEITQLKSGIEPEIDPQVLEEESNFIKPFEQIERVWIIDFYRKKQSILDQKIHIKHGLHRGETFKRRKLAFLVEAFEFVNELKDIFKYWSEKKMDREAALFEFVDGIHFLMSLANDLNVPELHPVVFKYEDPIDQIFALTEAAVHLNGAQTLFNVFALYRGLGDHFGFTEEEIQAAYIKKNEENFERQANNY